MTDAASLGTILGVWAHPDDDIFLTAGLMAAAVRAGARVVDVTATRGEGGSMDEERWPSATMGEVRTAELLRSLEILGVTDHRFLDGPVDVDMDAHLDEAGAAQVWAIVDEVQPDTILTFGPDGMTGHRGHMDVCRWATEAFEAAAKPGARLYYATQTPEFVAEVVPAIERFNIFRPGTPPVTPREQLGIDFGVEGDLLDLKIASLEAHESQIEGLLEVFGDEGLRRFLRDESFRDAGRTEG
ncbi:MAG: PIG-L family deacetylase [Actinomycetota bacterium]